MSCAKMAEQIKMLLGLWTWVAPRNHVLGVGLDSPGGRGKFGGHFPVHYIRNIWHEPELFARARCMPSSSVGRVLVTSGYPDGSSSGGPGENENFWKIPRIT